MFVKARFPDSAQEATTGRIYSACGSGTLAVSNVEAPMVLFRNPGGSGKRARVIIIRGVSNSTSSQDIQVRLRATPTITTALTAITVVSNHLGGSAPSSVMTPFLQPVASAFGTLMDAWDVSSGVASGVSNQQVFNGQLVLEPGTDLLITGTPDGTNRAFSLSIRWIEE